MIVPREPKDRHAGGEHAEQCDEVVGHPALGHHRLCIGIVARRAGGEIRDPWHQLRKRGGFGTRPSRQNLKESFVVHVLMRQHDQLEILDAHAALG